MSARISDLVAELQQPCRDLIAACDAAGLQPRLTSTLRSHAEQKRLYARYLAGQAGFPVAPPGSSAHEYGEAFDLVVSPMDYLADVGATWLAWGGYWGPGDAVHFELLGATSRAKKLGAGVDSDIFLPAAKAISDLPWYIGLLAPWEISLYADMPAWIRNLLIVPRPIEEVHAVFDLLRSL
jgi:hypothetical protein